MPPNSRAKVYIPAAGRKHVKEGGKPAEDVNGVRFLGTEASDAVGNHVIYQVGSGVYDFTVLKLPEETFPEPMNNSPNLAKIARISASSMHVASEKEPGFEAFKTNDGDPATSWRAGAIKGQWLEATWPKPRTFDEVRIDEVGGNITSHEVQAWKDGTWKTLARGETCGSAKKHSFAPVTSTKCRILFTGASSAPAISEWRIRNAEQTENAN